MTENRNVLFHFIILYFSIFKIFTVSNGSFRKTTSLILSIISLSSIQSDSSILHLILFIHSLFKSCTTNITTFITITFVLYFSISFKYTPFYPSLSSISFPNGRFIHLIFFIFFSIHASSRLSFKYVLVSLSFFINRSKYKT